MTDNEKRDLVIQNITGLLQTNPFTFEFKVKKNPKGIKVIYEVTQEQMDRMIDGAVKKHREG